MIERPKPRGINQRGAATWSGTEIYLWRRALSVTQGDAARRASTAQATVSVVYENRRAPVNVEFKRVVAYLDAIERAAEANAKDQADSAAELKALRATLPEVPAVVVTRARKVAPRYRTRAEAEAILAEQRTESGYR